MPRTLDSAVNTTVVGHRTALGTSDPAAGGTSSRGHPTVLWLCLALLSVPQLTACGLSDEVYKDDAIVFKKHALACEMAGLEAKLQVTGIDGFCPLEVRADNTVAGRCEAIPTGEVRSFRLVYFVIYFVAAREVEVQLATALEVLDLTGERRRSVTLEFPNERIDTDFDDDGDGVSNLLEVCMNRNPLVMDP